MYEKLKTTTSEGLKLKHYHHVSVSVEFVKDCLMWESFLEQAGVSELCWPFVNFDDEDDDHNSVVLDLATDASLNKKFGMGGTYNKHFWFVAQWNSEFIEHEKPSIEFLELYALVTGILIWGDRRELRNSRVSIFCDNESMKFMINNLCSTCIQCRKLIRIFILNCIQFNRRVFVKDIRSEKNTLPDALSRREFRRFWRNAPSTMNWEPCSLPSSIWPLEKVWFN